MNILSIYPGHNATVGYFKNGKCIYILHEEKFTNIKNHLGFPEKCLKYIDKKTGIKNIDHIVFGMTTYLFMGLPDKNNNTVENTTRDSRLRLLYDYVEYKTGWKFIFTNIRNIIFNNIITPRAHQKLEEWFDKTYGIKKEQISYFDHHLCHAITPLHFYGISPIETNKLLLFSMDGAGDFSFAKIFIYDTKKRQTTCIADSSFDASLGLLYSEVTKFLGMKPNEHEYKVMGLAAYVTNPRYFNHIYEKLAKIVWLDKKTLTFRSRFNLNTARLYLKDELSCERFDNVAAAVQKLLEDLIGEWIRAAIEKTKITTISVSGGVFMNVKLNQKILEIPQVKKVYFQPSCSDESIVIGAVEALSQKKKLPTQPIRSMFLGLSYSDNEVLAYLKRKQLMNKYFVRLSKNIEKDTSLLLSKNHIVARFKRRGEWGARSLCHRAILGNARHLETFYEVNDMIKMRDFWMPFAPTILAEWADKYIKNWNMIKKKTYESTRYMILTCDSTELAQKHLRAGIHQKDKTLRPQIVDEHDDPETYQLLKYYEKLTGMGGVLNTSLNLHGDPLVGTLEQALHTFEHSGLRYMTLENYLLAKK